LEEINSIYGKGSSGEAAEQRRSDKKKSKPSREENKAEAQNINFDIGFDHGFENMATFNGRTVGKDGGPAQSTSLTTT